MQTRALNVNPLRAWRLALLPALVTAALALAAGCSSAAADNQSGPAPTTPPPSGSETPVAPLTPTPIPTTPMLGNPDGGVVLPIPTPGPVPTTPTPAPSAPPVTVNDAFFVQQLQAAGAPGAAMAIVKHGQLQWAHGYGFAQIETQRPATPDTLFMLASISKTFGATALLQLAESSPGGLAVLDQDINVGSNLGFTVRNPYFPNSPITYRMLLTHTSSLIDGPYFQDFDWQLGDSQLPLGNFLAGYLQDINNWAQTPPGSQYSYSNAGASLIGHIVERTANMNLQQFSQNYIFAPLGMSESSWFLNGLDQSHIAMPYFVQNGSLVPSGQYGFPDYPDGQLRTSASQLARFLIMLSGDGSFVNVRILQPSTIAEMRRPQLPPGNDYQGLILFSSQWGAAQMIGHNGATLGGSNDMWFDPATSAGYILLANTDAYRVGGSQQDAMWAINNELARIAESIP